MTEPRRDRPAAPPLPAAGRAPEPGPSPAPEPPPVGAPRVHAEIHTLPPEWLAWQPPPRATRDAAALATADTDRPPASPAGAATPPVPALTPSAPLPRSDELPIVVGRDHHVLGRFQRNASDPEIAALRGRETLPGEPLAVAVTPAGAPVLSEPPPALIGVGAAPGTDAPAELSPPAARERSTFGLALAVGTGAAVGAVIAGFFWVGAPTVVVPAPREQARVVGTRPPYVVRDAVATAPTPAPTVDAPPTTPADEGAVTVSPAEPTALEASAPRATVAAPQPTAGATARASATPAGPTPEPPPTATGSSGPRLRLVRPRGASTTEGAPP